MAVFQCLLGITLITLSLAFNICNDTITNCTCLKSHLECGKSFKIKNHNPYHLRVDCKNNADFSDFNYEISVQTEKKISKFIQLKNCSISNLSKLSNFQFSKHPLSNSLRISNSHEVTLSKNTHLANLDRLYITHNEKVSIKPSAFDNLNLTTLIFDRNNLLELENPFIGSDSSGSSSSKNKRLRNLNMLSFIENNLTELTEAFFEGLDNLKFLVYTGNHLSVLANNTFRWLHQLNSLYLNNNELTEVNVNTFAGLENLKILDVSSNYLISLDNYIFRSLHQLKKLNLNQNNIIELPEDTFFGLDNLEDLDISRNFLTSIGNGSFRGLTNLKKLDISRNRLTSFDKSFQYLHQLIALDLSNNYLKELTEDAFVGLNNLNTLNLASNRIILVKSFKLNHLENSTLTDLTYSLIGLKGLKKLDISGNSLNISEEKVFELMQRSDITVLL